METLPSFGGIAIGSYKSASELSGNSLRTSSTACATACFLCGLCDPDFRFVKVLCLGGSLWFLIRKYL